MWTLALTSAGTFMAALDNLVVVTALPVIREDLAGSLADLEWIVNGYTLPFACLLLLAAALGDRFGRRKVFAGGVVSLQRRLPWRPGHQHRRSHCGARRAGLGSRGADLGWLALVAEPDVSYVAQVPALVLCGTGMGMFFAPTGAILMNSVAPAEQGIASGVNNSIREVGGALGVAVLASVFAANGGLRDTACLH